MHFSNWCFYNTTFLQHDLVLLKKIHIYFCLKSNLINMQLIHIISKMETYAGSKNHTVSLTKGQFSLTRKCHRHCLLCLFPIHLYSSTHTNTRHEGAVLLYYASAISFELTIKGTKKLVKYNFCNVCLNVPVSVDIADENVFNYCCHLYYVNLPETRKMSNEVVLEASRCNLKEDFCQFIWDVPMTQIVFQRQQILDQFSMCLAFTNIYRVITGVIHWSHTDLKCSKSNIFTATRWKLQKGDWRSFHDARPPPHTNSLPAQLLNPAEVT